MSWSTTGIDLEANSTNHRRRLLAESGHDSSCALTSSPFGFESGSEFGLIGLTDLHHALGFWSLAALCRGEVLGPGPFLPLLFCCSFRVICCKSAIYPSLAANSLLLGCDFVAKKLVRRW